MKFELIQSTGNKYLSRVNSGAISMSELMLLDYFLQVSTNPSSSYKDKKYEGGISEFEENLQKTSTLYIGNLSFFTTEEQIFSLFSKCGLIKRIIMGLDRNKKTPCGFAFIEYYDRQSSLKAKTILDGMKLDERFIRADLDAGFREGRQFGRGKSGGQVRDEFRVDYDPGRGGWGGSALEPQSKKVRY